MVQAAEKDESTKEEAEAALKPQFEVYGKAVDDEKWDVVEGFYHPNGVLVHKDKESVYGNKAITAYLAKFAEGTGNSVATISNAKYEGAGDYLIVTADFSAVTEKAGTVNGKFLQIWKKEGDRHLVYHDEFEITA
ncbi:hypothetical protein L5515_010116 [Caenorhabditis briggsae]|uniref:DUF4440 domain-containing protein n=1 Tax=Caenorhabditis briggsae TaxID=6238 RepID=A0AAE9JEM9_CAEBR|nr:hypothetical protein L5515_010116 [Caenorhabditis briggsae]